MPSELYKRYRPQTLDEVIGQDAAVRTIRGFKSIPHALLFDGPSGTGKTTLARIVARMLGTPPECRTDYVEKNCGSVESALEMARDIQGQMTLAPLEGKCRVWVLDEFQSLSRATYAQQALLKMFEDMPDHVYFMICTTEPDKVNKAIRSRCTRIPTGPIPDRDVARLVKEVAAAEKVKIADDLVDKIVDAAGGSARNALVELEKAIGIDDPAHRLDAVGGLKAEKVAFDLAKEIVPFNGAPNWATVRKLLEELKDEEPEGIRQVILALARNGLVNPKTPQARQEHCYRVIMCMADPVYDKNAGRAVLTAWCYQICTRSK